MEDSTLSCETGSIVAEKVDESAIVSVQDQNSPSDPMHEVLQQILLWNQTAKTYPEGITLHQLIEAQVERTPHAPATIFEDEMLTYQELNNRANQLALYLQIHGVKPEVCVGIYMERSLDLLIGLLAILKAGGAYVPLDPTYPQPRLAHMLQEAHISVVLTLQYLLPQFPTTAARIVCPDRERSYIASLSDANLHSPVAATNLAYVIYTSGSTGTPKGAMNTHKAICNRLLWMQDKYQLNANDRILQKTPFSFDVSVWEFFWPLLAGACLVIARPEGHRDSAYLVDVIVTHKITVLHFVPSMLSIFLEEPAATSCSTLRCIICSGEALPHDLQERCFARLDADLHNLYGPTEAAVDVTSWQCRRNDPQIIVPIGKPISNIQIYIVDPSLQPVQVGVVGALYIGGVGLARGYIQRADMTAERFIPDPFSREPGGRLYKTGDLARYLPSGDIEFLGRQDYQVKIRGFRIELGEVEAVLSRYPAIHEVAVLAHTSSSGDKRLVAYVVCRMGAPLDLAQVHAWLQERLPSYMIPAVFVPMERFPLSPNGKLDRRALPEPPRERSAVAPPAPAPRTPTEEILLGIWTRLLDLETIGVQENFFALGGHSLLATQVLARLRKTFQVDVSLQDFFAHPTLAELALLVQRRLTEQQRHSLPALQARVHPPRLPLSLAQQRLWFLQQLEPESPFYIIALSWRIQGELDRAALQQSLDTILHRHAILRSTIQEQDGQPFQVLHPILTFPLEVEDLRSHAHPQQAAQQRVHQHALRPFPLSEPLLVRGYLLQLGDQEHLLFVTVHHLIFDGWSQDVFVRELVACYEAFEQQRLPSLPALPIAYADYVLWQREWLQGEFLEQQVAYWRQHLQGASTVLTLPTDHARPPIPTFRGATQTFEVQPSVREGLWALSRQEEATLFMTLLAAFGVLLARYSGQSDLLIGSPLANRGQVELEELIGFFVNTLVLRVQVAGNPTFRTLLQRVRETTLAAYAHQDLPFERLVQEFQAQRTVSSNPLFQVAFVLQNTPNAVHRLKGVQLSRSEVASGTAKFDLMLELIEVGEGLQGTVEYSTDLFEASTIARLIGHFQQLVQAISADPDQPVMQYEFLSVAERKQIVQDWNATTTAYPRERCIHELFEEHVRERPEATAVLFEEEQVSYHHLNQRADRLAARLRRRGVGPEVLVGLCMERSVGMIVGVLAILKAGGAYVPLDPGYPAERLAYMVQDAQVRVVVTQRQIREQVPHWLQGIEALDEEEQDAEEAPGQATSTVRAANLAYVIYTSGSTGRPKGVSVTHFNVVRLVKETSYATFSPEEVFLQFAPIAFDASTFEIWGCLLNGARLVVFPPHTSSLNELQHIIEKQHITTLWLTAGLFHQMVEYHLDCLSNVKQVLAGGDVLSASQVKRVLASQGKCTLINGYGPTENTTFTCCYPMTKPEQVGSSVPIGYPIANTQVYILDEQFLPVPIGIAGELYIGGAGLAREYLKQPDLTAQKFVPHPFSKVGGERLYRTGDLARFRSDGTIEFLGRQDYQVKIRGFRIELGEVEAVLSRYPAIREVAVLAHTSSSGDKYLVAYLICMVEEPLDRMRLHAWLQERLPSYMIPAVFVPMERFPLSPNGKLDRRALPEPPRERSAVAPPPPAPRTPTEEILLGIWTRLLDLETIGVQENFFALGGHSLLVTQVLARLRKTFQVDVSLQDFFAHPTLAELALLVQRRLAEQQHHSLPALQARVHPPRLPLSLAQQRLWFLQQLEPESPFYIIALSWRIQGELDRAALQQSLDTILHRHAILRSTIQEQDGQPFQVLHPILTFPLEVEDLRSHAHPQQVAQQRVHQHALRPFPLSEPLLVRGHLLQLGDQEHLLFVTVHHLIFDGWSQDVFVRELVACYEAFEQQRLPSLPALPIAYADYVLWQREWLQGEFLEQQVAYWRQHLQGASTVLTLPTDHARPPIPTFRGATQTFEVQPSVREGLWALSRQEEATLFMTLLAAFGVLLARYSGQPDLLIGSPLANRGQVELEELIGFFVNTLVLRVQVAGNPTFRTLLQRVRETTLAAYAHQDLPFERLVQEVQAHRTISSNPLFQAAFVLQNTPNAVHRLKGVQLSRSEVASGTAKFDLMLELIEVGEGLQGTVEYSTDLFEASTIARLIGHFQQLVQAISADPDQPVMQYEFLSVPERKQIVQDWNATTTAYPRERCIHELFEEHVRERPEATAVLFEEEQVSYRELNQRADRLAARLRRRGVGPEVLVGLCMERSVGMIVGVLAILKAGGAYVPLDPGYPTERLAYMVQDAQVRVVVTQRQIREQIPHWLQGIEALDEEEQDAEEARGQEVASAVSAANLAYVIYTSGSTGRPKGVMVSHEGLASLGVAQKQAFKTGPESRVLQFASLSFDASIWEIVMAFSTGGTLCLATPNALLPGVGLLKLLEEKQITITTLSPSVLAALPIADLPALRTLVTAGEACSAELVADWSTGRQFFNAYGPTETTVCASMMQCQDEGKRPGIGTPIANMQMYVLDAYWQLCPIGVPGELYIAGVGLARGYLGRPELTAERFIPNPFSQEAGARLYRTGDRASIQADGTVEFLGRLDQQVKIRGFRIELGEIEDALNKQPTVHESIVIVREDVVGEKRIVAYIIPEAGATPTSGELRQPLKKVLPEYMIPATFMLLDAFPLTTNAKVDIRALPAPEASDMRTEVEYVAPGTPIEQKIAGAWHEILRVEKIGIYDNFFDVGGHSLLLTRLHSRLQEVLQRDISLVDLFQHTTIAAQKTLVSEEAKEELKAAYQQGQELAVARNAALEQQWQLRQRRRVAEDWEQFED